MVGFTPVSPPRLVLFVSSFAFCIASQRERFVLFFSQKDKESQTPAATAAALQKQIADAMALPDVKAKFAEQGAEPRGWSTEQTGRFIQAESAKWNKVIKSANVTLE